MDGSRSTQPVRQRFFLFLFVILAAGLVVMPVAWWMVGAQNRPRPKSPAGTPTAKPSQPSAPPATDATRATPAELRDALYATETFLGVPTLVPGRLPKPKPRSPLCSPGIRPMSGCCATGLFSMSDWATSPGRCNS
ncbi:hypothetical protein [Chloracidobacterium thermophilum]|uniref:hypothetical protein n=1 Tax=Chloracidobacterium thermophilum TaxID=458033 RepID=UPI001BB2EBA2|nr:hypothetical protein [Chloracidobacterium thermophilum]QUV77946.1 hypothetical protein J8C08_07410 [Chloracidobacterium thermophilum]